MADNLSNVNFNIPDLKALLDSVKMSVKSELNCVSLGTIKSFDATTQTASIQINCKKVLKAKNSVGVNQSNDVTIAYPLLVKCPVVTLNGGGAFISFPIVAGDTCVVFFSDRDFDGWLSSGSPDLPPSSERLHDLSGGIALVGIRPASNPILNYFTGAKFGYANASVTIDALGNLVISTPLATISIDQLGNILLDGEIITNECWTDYINGNAEVESGADGVFTSGDGKTVTVVKGIIVGIG